MSDCSEHKKDLFGETDMGKVSRMIADLHYEALAELFGRLTIDLYKDSLGDRMGGREELGYALLDASNNMKMVALNIKTAYKISKPFMNPDKKNNYE